jgi:hypothetical protein
MKKTMLLISLILMVVMPSYTKDTGFDKIDFAFDIGSSRIELDSDVTVLLDILGDDYEFSEAPSCVYEGTDKYYTYDDIEIYTYPYDGNDLIDEIVLTGPAYYTNRGIRTGDLFRNVEIAYGDDYVMDGDIVTYSLDPDDPQSPVLYFMIENDTVASIHYYKASNISP